MASRGHHGPTLQLPAISYDDVQRSVEYAARIIRSGGLVAFPTETVYGLGADATNADAIEAIFSAKERPHSDPLIVHLPSASALATVVASIPPLAYELAERFWPGPLTLILPRASGIPASVSAGGPTVGVRVPRHPVALALLQASGVPIVAPSANRFMHTSPTTAAHVLEDLDGRIDAVLDAGPCEVGVESTVLNLTSDPPCLLRPGGITFEALRDVIANIRLAGSTSDSPSVASQRPALAPGQMERHYAPRTPLIVFDGDGPEALSAILAEAARAIAAGQRVGILVADEEAEAFADMPVTLALLGPRADLAVVSRQLYAALRELDSQDFDLLVAHTFGREGLGLALWDRLRKAAGGTLRTVSSSEGF